MKVEGEQIVVDRTSSTKKAREQHALYRTLANNMFVGVSTGFERKLKLVGVGYKAAMQGSKAVSLSLGKAAPGCVRISGRRHGESRSRRRS